MRTSNEQLAKLTESRPLSLMGTPVDSGNRGVYALGSSLLSLCANADPTLDLELLIGNKDSTPASFRVRGMARLIPVTNYRLSPRSRPQDHLFWIVFMAIVYRFCPLGAARRFITFACPWVKSLERSRWVGDVRGGDSFSDIYGIKRFLLGTFEVWSVILVRGSIVQFPQTYGPYNSLLSRIIARYILRRSSTIIARDKKSQKVAQELVGEYKPVLLSPDVAFALEPVRPQDLCVDPATADIPSGVIGLNVNGLMYRGGYTRNNMFGLKLEYQSFLKSLVIALLSKTQGELWLIPHTLAEPRDVESDNGASQELLDQLPLELRKRVRLVKGDHSAHELKWIIGQCDFFIGSRMHSCIAALSQGIPCVGVAYSMKFEGVFESVGMTDWVIDGRTATNEQALNRSLSLFDKRNDVRGELKAHAENARGQLTQIFKELVSGDQAKTRTNPTPHIKEPSLA